MQPSDVDIGNSELHDGGDGGSSGLFKFCHCDSGVHDSDRHASIFSRSGQLCWLSGSNDLGSGIGCREDLLHNGRNHADDLVNKIQ